ncbi:MAG: hypothetical protein ACOX4Z_11355 [Desulfobulbus sp.]|jgi:hypothetical protein
MAGARLRSRKSNGLSAHFKVGSTKKKQEGQCPIVQHGGTAHRSNPPLKRTMLRMAA